MPRGVELYPEGTYLRYRGGSISRVANDRGTRLEVVFVPNANISHAPPGTIFERPDEHGAWADCIVNGPITFTTVVYPCDCPRHEGTLTFHETGGRNA